jgi:hypothetical protein
MKQRTFLWVFLSFLGGMGVAYGLMFLDEKANVPRLDRNDIFEAVASDGTVVRLSYSEIERERAELRRARQKIEGLERAVLRTRGQGTLPAVSSPPGGPPVETPPEEAAASAPPEAKGSETRDKNLQDLFARIFSQPVMEDLVEAQIDREAGELADVLDLTDEQLAALEQELRRRRKNLPGGFRAGSSGPASEEAEPETSLEEELPSILTPEQLQKYQEYTEKKTALQSASPLEKEAFELEWRLDLLEEQITQVREILKEQDEKMRQLSPAAAVEGDATPAERLELHLEQRTALNKETAERMKTVLDEEQYEAFARYQKEKDTETRLLKRLIQEEQAGESRSTP